MNRHTNKGNGFLKDKFGGFQADPPPEVWDAISSQLGGRRRRGMTIIILSAAASLALAVSLGIAYFGRDIPHEIELAEDHQTEDHQTEARESVEHESAGLELKVVEAIKAARLNEVVPGNNDASFAISEGKPKLEGSAKLEGNPGLEENTISEEGTGLEENTIAEEGTGLERNANAEDITKAQEIVRDDESAELILDAGAVGDVGAAGDMEMAADLGELVDSDPRWMLGAMLSPLYSFRDAEPEALAGTSGQESGMVSYATGVQVGYRATRRLAIESGIIYNKMGLSIGAPGIQVFANNQDFEWAAPEIANSTLMAVTNSVGNIVSYSGEVYVNNYKLNGTEEINRVDNAFNEPTYADQGIRQHLDYLEIPFNLRYTLLDRSFKIQVLGGVSTNFLVNNYVTMESEAGTSEIGYLTNIRNVNYSGNAGVGFVYHFLEQLSLNVEPRFRYYLNSVNDATLPSTRPYTLGIYTGLNYFF